MANPSPETIHLKPHQWQPLGDRPLSDKVIGTRYPQDIHDQLMAMESGARQEFIREAVESKLQGNTNSGIAVDALQQHINAVLSSMPIKDRKAAAKLFEKLLDRL